MPPALAGDMRTLIATLLLFAACVTDPVHQSRVASRRAPVDFRGYATQPGALIRILAWDFHAGHDQVIATATASTTPSFTDPSMYAWQVEDIVLLRRFWMPDSFPCSSGGMARFYIYEGTQTSPLPTFTQAEKDCIIEEVMDGTHPAAAGRDCWAGGRQLLLFAPPECP